MLNQVKKKSILFVVSLILVVGLSISAQSLLAAWTAPTVAPPGGFANSLLHTGVATQSKTGSLMVLGDVGIGTIAPNKELHVKTSVGNAEIDIQSEALNHWGIYHDIGTEQLRFWNASSDNALVIDDNGNVGVGTINPAYKLDVNGKIRMILGTVGSDAANVVATKGYVDAHTDNDSVIGNEYPQAGIGITVSASRFVNADTSYLQRRINASCTTGSSIRAISATGAVTCEIDTVGSGDITGVTAGTGLSGGGLSGSVTVNADTSYLQRRVSASCAVGSSIRAISATGAVTCEADTVGSAVAIPCSWTGWAGVGEQAGARHVNNCGTSYLGFIDLYCSSGVVTNTRLVKSTDCE